MPLSQLSQYQIDTHLAIIYYDANHTEMINGVKFESGEMKSMRIKNSMTIEELNTKIQHKGEDESRILRQIWYRCPAPAYGSVEYYPKMINTDADVQQMLTIYNRFRRKYVIELDAKFVSRMDLERQNELCPWPGSQLSYLYYRCGIINARDGVKFVANEANPPEPLRLQHDITFEELKEKIHRKLRLGERMIKTIICRYPQTNADGHMLWSMYDVLTTWDVGWVTSKHRAWPYNEHPMELCIRTTMPPGPSRALTPMTDPPVRRSVQEIMDLFREPQ